MKNKKEPTAEPNGDGVTDNDLLQTTPDEKPEKKGDKQIEGGHKGGYSWSDIAAFCLAFYRLLLPQLLLTFLAIIVILFLAFFVWF